MASLIIKTLKPLLNILENYRWSIFGLIYGFGVFVYAVLCKKEWLVAGYEAFALFALNVSTVEGSSCNTWVYIAGLLAAFYTVMSVVSLVARRFVNTQSVVDASSGSYILVCGLGKKAVAYIDSELEAERDVAIIAIEKDAQNPNIEKYRTKGVAVQIADAKDTGVLKALHIANAKHIVVLAGKDAGNLEIALALREVSKKEKLPVKRLYMHIDDRGLDKFYKDGGLLDDSAKLEVKMFSMSRNGAKALFLEHDVDGVGRAYMDSSKSFGLVVAGYSKLAIEVVGQICELAHLPNENKVTIYCIDEDIATFQQIIAYQYANIDKIPNINIEYVSLDHQSRAYYEHLLWRDDISHVMLCYEDAHSNLDIASELSDSTYLHDIHKKSLTTKIHIAIYDSKLLAQNIKNNEEHFKYFDVFAQTTLMASKEMIVDEKFELIAKCIHAGYEMRYNPDAMFSEDKAIEKAWNKTANLADRVSNRSQAYHIPTKLKAMGLSMRLSGKSSAERLLHNKEVYMRNVHLQEGLKAEKLDAMSLEKRTNMLVGDKAWDIDGFDYFPSSYSTLIEKLLRAEHNRWNAHHWLKGWEHNSSKNKKLKWHDCLVALDELPDTKRPTVIYDIYSVLYMPNLLAKAGYELVEAEDV